MMKIPLKFFESARLEDLSKKDKSTNTDCILFTENFMQTDIPVLQKGSLTDV